jgi:MscS family membrane protein
MLAYSHWRRWQRAIAAGLLTLLLCLLAAPWAGIAAGNELTGPSRAASASLRTSSLRTSSLRTSSLRTIPISEQPFYPELLATAQRWSDAPLDQVVGDSPLETLLNFYAVMAKVNQEVELISLSAKSDPGWFWSEAARQRQEHAEMLFSLAVQALDASGFAESIRKNMAEESAMQLKQLLDYIFTHSTTPLEIPDSAGIREINSQRSKASDSWTIPDTSITLSSERLASSRGINFFFTATTVSETRRMFKEIEDRNVIIQPFATPTFYKDFINTPGFLLPPQWYLRLPPRLRAFLEISFYEQTIFQISAATITFAIYAYLLCVLLLRLLRSYRDSDGQARPEGIGWNLDNLAWRRVLLLLPIPPITWLCNQFTNNQINFTGPPLIASTYFFSTCFYISSSFFLFFLFEALGRSLSEALVHLRGGSSELQLRRVSNLMMPVCRVIGGLLMLTMIYHLLIELGLPSTTVLAFSAVPGLAIGLGASKLLGNLFAGLSIQTDRPLRVGEFCRIGDHLGFVTKIGLRSLELETMESRVTIPNAIADEENIVNYSRRSNNSNNPPMQSLDVRLNIDRHLSPEQIISLLSKARKHVHSQEILQDPLISIEQNNADGFTLICFSMVAVHDWRTYLDIRESLLLRLQQILDQVCRSRIVLSVNRDTNSEQITQLTKLITEIVDADPKLRLRSCRLLTISPLSYDFVIDLESSHTNYLRFKDGLHRLNQALLTSLSTHDAKISEPTSLNIQKIA